MISETDVSGTQLASYTLGASELLQQTRGGNTSYYHQDGQGNVRALADATGAVTDRYAYDALGNLQNRQGNTINSYQYTSQRFDTLTGLYDLRAR